ncbi:hypothetical protein [Herbaspirillum aquaticum]|uniref:hypothetical protein n=1 Tax=Herbaspirillum aquaticum TaxID=568783 RepID=UPI0011324C9E|nr:hypothetical protein [Herbaspirillum aquaticum]
MEQLQLPEFGGLNDRGNVLSELCSCLPSLPSTLRYYDEFNDVTRSISNPQERPNFELMINGKSIRLDFTHISSDCRTIFKHVFAFALSKDLSIQTSSSAPHQKALADELVSTVSQISTSADLVPSD